MQPAGDRRQHDLQHIPADMQPMSQTTHAPEPKSRAQESETPGLERRVVELPESPESAWAAPPATSGLFKQTPIRHAKSRSITVDHAQEYANAINSNKPWSWVADVTNGHKLNLRERKAVKAEAARRKLIKDAHKVHYKKDAKGNDTHFADFSKVARMTLTLPKKLFKETDREQFKWLDQKLDEENARRKKRGRPIIDRSVHVWHHVEKTGTGGTGQMQLVPFGLHNATPHHGGRSIGQWGYAKRK